jgi:NAD(P)-dependent dehydrogenase (short-subunit alcohol dehydrogenase family)
MGNSAASFDYASVEDQRGTTFIITGANAGLGFECAQMLAKKNGRIVLACRTESNGKAAMEDIKAKVPEADLGVFELDVSNLQSISRFVDEFIAKERCEKLVLINNAEIMALPLTKTPDGRARDAMGYELRRSIHAYSKAFPDIEFKNASQGCLRIFGGPQNARERGVHHEGRGLPLKNV